MSVYLDASVLGALLRSEAGSATARAFISDTRETLIVSDFARGEIGSVASRLVRMKALTAQAATQILADFDEWLAAAVDQVATSSDDIRLAAQLVRRFDLRIRMPDAIHLAATLNLRVSIATFDGGLASAAKQLGINVEPVG